MEFAALFDVILVFTLGLARFIAIFAMLPIFGKSVLVGSTRNAVAVSFALFLFPMYGPEIDPRAIGGAQYTAILVKEIVLGIVLGFGFATVFYAVESMGFFIDNQRGSAMASSVDPLTGSQTSPLGIFLTQVITVFLFVSGAFFVLLLAIYESYVLFPVQSFFPTFRIEDSVYALSILDRIISLAIMMAAPALIAMFLSEFALGLVSRFAPQLNVFFLAMPVKSAVGILMLILYVTLLMQVWERELLLVMTHVEVLGATLR